MQDWSRQLCVLCFAVQVYKQGTQNLFVALVKKEMWGNSFEK